jgi:hypothetical protein
MIRKTKMSGKYALLIGNTEYSDPGLTQLTAPGKDTEDFARVLKDLEICAFDQVKVLFNELSSTVIEAIDEFFDQRKSDDLLVLYFSGHGVRDELGSLYLAVKNTIRSRLRSTAIRSDYIREAMDQSHSKRQVLILDCCNSGAFPQGTKAEIGGAMGMTQAFQGYGRFVLTASDATQFAWEGNTVIGETQNSLFTHFLVKGLEGDADSNGDGKITIDELYDFAYEQISRVTPKQTPTKSASKQEGEIILRQSMRIEDIKPVPLPTTLLDSIENPFPDVRLGTVQQLTKLLNGKNLGLARSAREALERIAENDDSRQVSKAAAESLEASPPAERPASRKVESKRSVPQKAREAETAHKTQQAEPTPKEVEAEGLVPKKLEQNAEGNHVTQEKTSAERKTKEQASDEAEETAEKEKAKRQATRSSIRRETSKRAAVANAQKEPVKKPGVNESKPAQSPWIRSTTIAMIVIALLLCGFLARNYLRSIGGSAPTEPSTTILEAPTLLPTEEPTFPPTEEPVSISLTKTRTPRPDPTERPRSTSTSRPTLVPASVPTSQPTFTARPLSGTCKDGYVQRLIVSSDKVCVSPESKAQANADNEAAGSRTILGSLISAYGENACAYGYVWRNAFEGDLACVEPGSRDQAAWDNEQGPSRVDQAASPNCVSGFVWRVARDSDLVCVEPYIRDQTQIENSVAESYKAVNVYDGTECLDGYVWREAYPGDLVCVTPEVYQQVAQDNQEAPNHTWP